MVDSVVVGKNWSNRVIKSSGNKRFHKSIVCIYNIHGVNSCGRARSDGSL